MIGAAPGRADRVTPYSPAKGRRPEPIGAAARFIGVRLSPPIRVTVVAAQLLPSCTDE